MPSVQLIVSLEKRISELNETLQEAGESYMEKLAEVQNLQNRLVYQVCEQTSLRANAPRSVLACSHPAVFLSTGAGNWAFAKRAHGKRAGAAWCKGGPGQANPWLCRAISPEAGTAGEHQRIHVIPVLRKSLPHNQEIGPHYNILEEKANLICVYYL